MTAVTADSASKWSDRPPRISSRWLWAHGIELVLIAGIVVFAGRGNWFFYDEWDFLRAGGQWDLLAPHNGHLSLFPQLLTTLVKSVVGLHSYWPFLGLTILAHLAVVHMLWRLMMRCGVTPELALAVSAVFGVLAPGAENTLWAFQVGFITPIVTGVAALLFAMRPTLGAWDPARIAVLLLIGVGFASTALPILVALCAYLVLRHGWRSAVVPAGSFVVLYGAWYLSFARGSTGADGFGVSSLSQLLTGVPEYVGHSFVDSVGKLLPMAGLAPALLVALTIGAVIDVRRRPIRDIGAPYVLAVAAGGFALLTALTRVGLGVESASTGRYVYVYAALVAPLVAWLLTCISQRSRVAVWGVIVLLAVAFFFNAGGLVREGRNQAALERTVEGTMSAALSLDDGSSGLAARTPAAVVAPTLTMADVRDFVARGQFTPGPFTPADILSARVNLFLTAVPAPADEPAENCRTAQDGWVRFDIGRDLLRADTAVLVGVVAEQDGTQSFGTLLRVDEEGTFSLDGLAQATLLRIEDVPSLCVLAG